jgi:hypothetical protein
MSSDYDPTEFIDGDLQARPAPGSGAAAPSGPLSRAPTREEVDSKVAETQRKLAELKRAQEELERERSALEETRRRQVEFQTGRQEIVQHLIRGVGLLEEAEFTARRDAEQYAKVLIDLREALGKVQQINDQVWTRDSFQVELTRALTTLENARLEWNAARLKFPVLTGPVAETAPSASSGPGNGPTLARAWSLGELCRLYAVLSWPLAAVAALALVLLLIMALRH